MPKYIILFLFLMFFHYKFYLEELLLPILFLNFAEVIGKR